MFCKHHPINPIIRFRRWSRKRNAAFLSLGRIVTIGCLSKSVTEASLGKQRGVILTDADVWAEQSERQEEEDSGGLMDVFSEMTLPILLLQRIVREGNCCYKTKYW